MSAERDDAGMGCLMLMLCVVLVIFAVSIDHHRKRLDALEKALAAKEQAK